MKRLSISSNNIDNSTIQEVTKILAAGGIAALPTETVYGLAGRYDNKHSIERLYALKNRPKDKPFSLATNDPQRACSLLATLPPFGYRLIEEFWPGPLTLIYHAVDGNVYGMRVPDHPVIGRILKELGTFVFLPSANISGQPETTTAQQVEDIFDSNIDAIVDSGPCRHGKPSTIVDLTFYPFKIVREGAVSEQHIIETFSRRRILFVCTGNTCRSPMAQFLTQIYLNKLSPYASQRYEILSRGIAAVNGAPASSGVLNVLHDKENIDVRGFVSQKLDRSILLSSDLIFTMEDDQYDYIMRMEPTVEGRLFHMKKFLSAEYDRDIGDPIGSGIEAYSNLYDMMSSAVNELIKWL